MLVVLKKKKTSCGIVSVETKIKRKYKTIEITTVPLGAL